MLTIVKRETGSASALGPADEADLIDRCRRDERAAQDELYHRFRRQVAGNLYRVLGDRTDLDDQVNVKARVVIVGIGARLDRIERALANPTGADGGESGRNAAS